jgi:hypothetical protein
MIMSPKNNPVALVFIFFSFREDFYDHRLAQDGLNCRFSIADCPAVAG